LLDSLLILTVAKFSVYHSFTMDTWTLLYISYIHNLQILVATPGRLRDHIENTPGFATRLMGVKVLVLDEADHLLDMGFRKEIEKIIAAVPKQRQTLLFSATVPEEVSITIF
jgi:superfamily II DNA/RNA helicase